MSELKGCRVDVNLAASVFLNPSPDGERLDVVWSWFERSVAASGRTLAPEGPAADSSAATLGRRLLQIMGRLGFIAGAPMRP